MKLSNSLINHCLSGLKKASIRYKGQEVFNVDYDYYNPLGVYLKDSFGYALMNSKVVSKVIDNENQAGVVIFEIKPSFIDRKLFRRVAALNQRISSTVKES